MVDSIVGINTNRIHEDLVVQQVGDQRYTKIRYYLDPDKDGTEELLTTEGPAYIYRETDKNGQPSSATLSLVGGGTVSIPAANVVYCYLDPATYERSSVDVFVGSRRRLYKLEMTFLELLTELNAPGVNTTRITSTPYTVLVTDEVLFVNTDTAASVVNLPVGFEAAHYKIINTGSSGNDVTVSPQTGEELYGSAVASILSDGEVINIHYNATDGWW